MLLCCLDFQVSLHLGISHGRNRFFRPDSRAGMAGMGNRHDALSALVHGPRLYRPASGRFLFLESLSPGS
eukprot:7888665-Pyramimonas_sp.AAC.2